VIALIESEAMVVEMLVLDVVKKLVNPAKSAAQG